MARPRVIIDSNFGRFEREIIDGAGRGLKRAGDELAREASGITGRYKIGGITGKTQAGSPERTARGIAVIVSNPDPRAIFFQKGTIPGPKGVKAQRFMTKPLKAIRAKLPDYIAQEIRW